MRKALNTPAVLFEWFTPAEGVTLEALLTALRVPERLSGASARRFFVADSPRVEAALGREEASVGAVGDLDLGRRAVIMTSGVGVWTLWEAGQAALEQREAFVLGASWSGLAASLACQPEAHLVALEQRPWSAPQVGALALSLVTVNAAQLVAHRGKRPPRKLLPRESLPVLPDAQLWPLIGHPGRLMVCADGAAGLKEAEERLVTTWGPPAEPARRWLCRSAPVE